jgi:hypothetical protein
MMYLRRRVVRSHETNTQPAGSRSGVNTGIYTAGGSAVTLPARLTVSN